MNKRKSLSLLMICALLLGLCCMTTAGYNGTGSWNGTFDGLTASDPTTDSTALIQGITTGNFMYGSGEDKLPYRTLYSYEPAYGAMGKGADDTSFKFQSQWDGDTIPPYDGNSVSDPFIQKNPNINYFSLDDIFHFSIEFAVMERSANRYVQLRPIVENAPSGSYWIEEDNILELPSSGKVNVFKQDTGMTMPLKRWVKFDFVVYLEDTSAEVFMDGKSIYPRTAFDACDRLEGIQPMTGVSMIRVGFTPAKVNNTYPLTTTYIDNFKYDVLTEAPTFSAKETKAFATFDGLERNVQYGSQGISYGNFDPSKGTYMFNHAPATGYMGKSSTDTSLSVYNDTSAYPHDLPLGEKGSGINEWRTHQYISIGDSKPDNLNDGDTVEFSANIALDKLVVSKSADVKTYVSGDSTTQYTSPSLVNFDTSGGLSILGVKVPLEKSISCYRWYNIRVIITPAKRDGSTSNKFTALINGKKLLENEPFKANNADTTTPFDGFGYIRFGYNISGAPLAGGQLLDNGKPAQYQSEGFYIDDIEYAIYRNSAPVIEEVKLTHQDPAFNQYIEEDCIVNYGGYFMSAGLFLNGLSGTNVKKFEFINAAGNPTDKLYQSYFRITTTQGKELYFPVVDGEGRGIYQSAYEFSNNPLSISKVPLRTPVREFVNNIVLYPDQFAEVFTASGNLASDNSYVETGMIFRVTSGSMSNPGSVVKDYIISSEKLIDETFDNWEGVVRANGQSSGDLHGWGFGCPPAETYDSAFVATTQPAGRNSLSLQLHSSNVKTDTVTDSYKHMSISKGGLNSSSLGDKFVMELSFMIDEASAMNYVVSKINDNQSWLNPIEFVPASQGQTINVWNVPVAKYELNQWYRLSVLSDKSTGECIVYLNGEKLYQGNPTSFAGFNYFAELRIQHQFEKNTTRNFYVDDFSVYSIYDLSTFDTASIDTSISSSAVTIIGNDINGFEGETTRSIMSKFILPTGANIQFFNNGSAYSGEIKTGVILRVTASDNITFRDYVFKTPNADIGPITFTVNSEKTNNKFSKGDIIAKADITCYKQGLPATLVIGQYEGSKLVGMNYATKNLSGADSITASFHTEKDTGTTIKIMLLDQLSSLKPLQLPQILEPFSNENIEVDKNYFMGWTRKALTFSYDDAPPQDTKLVGIFNDAGIKGTFNLISNRHTNAAEYERIRNLYQGHEIASHTYSHPRMQLTGLPDGYTPLTLEQCQEDITRGRSELEAIFNNAPMRGLAWPYGNPRRDDLTEWIAGTGVVYIRPTETTGNFDIPTNWLDWRTTCHHNALPTFGPRFLEQPDDGDLKLLAVWGHSYEFDKDPNASTPRPNDTWNIIEDFAAQVKGRDDIWKATNIEVYDYIQALDGLEITQTYVKNNSDKIAVNIMVNGKKAVIEPGMTYRP